MAVARSAKNAVFLAGITLLTGSVAWSPQMGPFLPAAPGTPVGSLRVSATNPRYFEDGRGRIVYLGGSHTWYSFQDGETCPPRARRSSDYVSWLKLNGHSFTKLWVWEQAKWAPWSSSDRCFTPLPFARPGPGTALDGQPKFDLTQWNQGFFDRLRSRVQQAQAQGILVSVMLFQGWSVGTEAHRPGNAWPGHPFNAANNINGINGDPSGSGVGTQTHELAIPAVTNIQDAFVKKVVDTLNDLDNVVWEISNEDPQTTANTNWQAHMISLLRSYEGTKPKQHPVLMTVQLPNNNAVLDASAAEAVSYGGSDIGDYAAARSGPPAQGVNKVSLLDSDHIFEAGGDDVWVWKAFARGHNILFMDDYQNFKPSFEPARQAIGQVIKWANTIDLKNMTPRGELASSGFALANPGKEYLVYLPAGGWVTVDLSGTAAAFSVQWADPVTGRVTTAASAAGGAQRSLKAPSGRPAVLYLVAGARDR